MRRITNTAHSGVRLQLSIRALFLISALSILGVSVNAADVNNLIADGSFEQPVTGPGGPDSGYMTFTVGQTIASAWTVVGPSGAGNINIYPSTETLNGSVQYNVPDGSQALDLTGDVDNGAPIGVEQKVNTTPGTTYDLSFEVGSTLGQPAIVNAYVNGEHVLLATNGDNTPGLTNWKPFTYIFTATGPSTVVDFYNGSQSGVKTAGLDNIRLDAAVPEPATYAIAGLGLLLIGIARRRYTKRASFINNAQWSAAHR